MSVDAKFIRDIDQYFKYPTDENPTTQQQYQEAVRNWVTTEEAIVDSHLWQPTTSYSEGNQVKTPSLPPQYVLVCTTAGTSGDGEPDYTDVAVGDSVEDGTVTWSVCEFLTSNRNIRFNNAAYGNPTNVIKLVMFGNSTPDKDGYTAVYGGEVQDDGANLFLHGKNNAQAGRWSLSAYDGTTRRSLVGQANGTLTWSGSDVLTTASTGTLITKSISSSVSISASTAKTITSINLTAGTWIITGHCYYTNITAEKIYGISVTTNANSFGYSSDGSMAIHSAYVAVLSLQTTRILILSSDSTVYLCGYATAACTANDADLRAVRIK